MITEQEITYKQWLDTMHGLRELANNVYPDRYKWVCMQHGIKESTAIAMYSHFTTICMGRMPYHQNQPLKDEQIANIIQMATEAKALYREHANGIDCIHTGCSRWGESFNRVMVVWTAKDDDEKQYTEMDFSSQETFITIGRMADNGHTIHHIIHQTDLISDTKQCMSLQPSERGKQSFAVYDGDVLLAYVDRPGFWSDDARHSGLYLCNNGAYRKLLYTPGKGYVRKGRPDIDDELEITLEDGCFNSHVLTIDQRWKRIGNVHVDTGFLIEQ